MAPPRSRRPAVLLLLLLLPALLWLGGTRAQECPPPERLHYAELEGPSSEMRSFPVGTTVSYVCRPGYVRNPEKSSSRTCGQDLQWSPADQFCTERKCSLPGDLPHLRVNVTDLTFGSKATFSCEPGFRLLGTEEISCVIIDGGVGWSRDLPYCESIQCAPPPDITNGRYTEANVYVYQTAVTYSCDSVPRGQDPFSLVGPDTIYCTYNENSDGVWSGPPPQCKVVKCGNPEVENGRKKSGFGPSYTYKDSVVFECDSGYVLVGPEVITCEENNNWSSKPTCERSVCGPPEITHGVVIPEKPVYEGGESVQIKCNARCTFPHGAEEMTVTCQGQDTWNSLQNCTCEPEKSGLAPHINYGRIIDGEKPSYSVGDFITIECYAGYTLHGEARIQYVGENRWTPGVPTCQLSGYITAIICVIVAVVLFLAAFWVYKKFFSQNGLENLQPGQSNSYTVDENSKEACILKANVAAEMEETAQMN